MKQNKIKKQLCKSFVRCFFFVPSVLFTNYGLCNCLVLFVFSFFFIFRTVTGFLRFRILSKPGNPEPRHRFQSSRSKWMTEKNARDMTTINLFRTPQLARRGLDFRLESAAHASLHVAFAEEKKNVSAAGRISHR